MGLLVEGVWRDRWYDTAASGGRFVRKDSAFRNWVTPDGAPGPTGRPRPNTQRKNTAVQPTKNTME